MTDRQSCVKRLIWFVPMGVCVWLIIINHHHPPPPPSDWISNFLHSSVHVSLSFFLSFFLINWFAMESPIIIISLKTLIPHWLIHIYGDCDRRSLSGEACQVRRRSGGSSNRRILRLEAKSSRPSLRPIKARIPSRAWESPSRCPRRLSSCLRLRPRWSPCTRATP